ncbi:hypothetical protein M8J75_008343 [Diaphorina citri]|nr:hypothetical protein M8J75_008343 [Diaphorina citri]
MADSDDEYDRKRRDKFRGERTESYTRGEGRREERRPRDDWSESEDSKSLNNEHESPPKSEDSDKTNDKSNTVPQNTCTSVVPYKVLLPTPVPVPCTSGIPIHIQGAPYMNVIPVQPTPVGNVYLGEGWNSRSRGRGDYRGAPRERYSPPRHEMSPPVKRMRPDWDEARPLPYERPVYPSAYNPGWPSHEPSYAPAAPRGVAPSSSAESLETQPPMLSLKAFMQTQDDNVGVDEALKKYNEYKLEFRRQQLNEFFVAHKDEEWFKLKYHPVDSVARKKELFGTLQRRAQVFKEFLEAGRIDGVRVDSDHTDQLTNLLDGAVIKFEGGTDQDMKILDITAETVAKAQAEKDKSLTLKDVKKEPVDKVEAKSDGDLEDEKKDLAENGVKDEGEDEEDKKIKDPDSPSATPGEENGVKKAEDPSSSPVEKGELSDDEDKENVTTIESDDVEQNGGESKNEPPPRALHRTSSIFLRNLAPTITKAEVENLCKRYSGFLRVAIADPQPDRRWFRRGWVTFRRDVDIKEICWNLNNIRLRDCELGAIVNRDLSRRVRTVSGLTSLKPVVQFDMKLSLWTDGQEPAQQPMSYTLSSKNPVLQNITDYLIEEASAEEEELLGKIDFSVLQVDPNVLRVLDRLILYLRIVHSVDYYNHCEYPNEDEMPNRCGIIHTRGSAPASKVTPQEITDYCSTFQNKMSSLVSSPQEPTPEELDQLGAKKTDAEVEKFIAANTQEISTDKWLCPLSGKKFKGPDFIRKHIFNKHAEKVEEVKKEVDYFNNYLKDPKRPQLPEHPGNKAAKKEPAVAEGVPPPAFAPPHFQYGAYPAYQPYPRGAFGGFARGGRGYGRGGRGGGMDYRPVIHYRDLDAPREPEEFI